MNGIISNFLVSDQILDQIALDEFENSLLRFDVKKGDVIFKDGDVSSNMYFVESGLVRQYYYTRDGKEVTEFFAFNNQGFGCIESIYDSKPSYLNAEALENSIIQKINLDRIEELCKKYIQIEYAYRKGMERALVLTQIRMRSILFQTALERYENLINDYPSIFQRVPTKYIASFLGVSRETLSRMKAM